MEGSGTTDQPGCPGAWVRGPYKNRSGDYVWRDACPVCGEAGQDTDDLVTMLHPSGRQQSSVGPETITS